MGSGGPIGIDPDAHPHPERAQPPNHLAQVGARVLLHDDHVAAQPGQRIEQVAGVAELQMRHERQSGRA